VVPPPPGATALPPTHIPRENAVATSNAIAARTLPADIVVPGGTVPLLDVPPADGSVVFVVETIGCRSSSSPTIDPSLVGGIAVEGGAFVGSSSSGKCHEE
jgi:hypothetical protein